MVHSNNGLAAIGFESGPELASMAQEKGVGWEEGGDKKIPMISIKGNIFLMQNSKCYYMEAATENCFGKILEKFQ